MTKEIRCARCGCTPKHAVEMTLRFAAEPEATFREMFCTPDCLVNYALECLVVAKNLSRADGALNTAEPTPNTAGE